MRRKKKRAGLHLFNKLVLVANVLAVISLLLAYAASYINPNTFWIPAFFGLAYPAFYCLLANKLPKVRSSFLYNCPRWLEYPDRLYRLPGKFGDYGSKVF